jgi:hypothetical protein
MLGTPSAPCALHVEILALRHQLRVLQRQTGPPRWQHSDRILLAAASRILPGPSASRPPWQRLPFPSPDEIVVAGGGAVKRHDRLRSLPSRAPSGGAIAVTLTLSQTS